MCKFEYCWHCLQKYLDHNEKECENRSLLYNIGFIVPVIMLIMAIDTSFGFQILIKLSSWALTTLTGPLVCYYTTAFIIANMLAIFIGFTLKHGFGYAFFGVISCYVLTDFGHVIINILIFEALLVICIIPIVILSLISLGLFVVSMRWYISPVTYFLIAGLFGILRFVNAKR